MSAKQHMAKVINQIVDAVEVPSHALIGSRAFIQPYVFDGGMALWYHYDILFKASKSFKQVK